MRYCPWQLAGNDKGVENLKLILNPTKMENQSNEKNLFVKHTEDENAPDTGVQPLKKSSSYEEAEKEWNSKIMNLTLKIHDQYPELLKYLDEMPLTLPTDKNPEVTLSSLKNYHESLNTLLAKYIKESPEIDS